MNHASQCIASIVIPSYLRPDLLSRCLEAICTQTFPQHQYEVIVADDAGSAETRNLVARFAERFECAMRCVEVGPVHGPAAARNAGWRAARGRIIAFTDDDCVPDPGWLAAGVRCLTGDTERAAAWGRLEMPIPATPTDYQRDASGLARAVFVTANCFLRRVALARIGGFDERFQVAWREDSDLYYSLLEQQLVVVHEPEALVIHPVRPAAWGVSLSQQRKSSFDVLLYRKHPELYRQHVPQFPTLYLWIAGSGVSAVMALLLGQYTWSAVAASVWLGLTLRFALKRLDGTSHSLGHVLEMLVTSALIPWLAIYYRLQGMWLFSSRRIAL